MAGCYRARLGCAFVYAPCILEPLADRCGRAWAAVLDAAKARGDRTSGHDGA